MDFDRLVQSHQKPVFAYLKKLVRDYQLAEDLCQEAFLRAFQASRREGVPSHVRPWLLRIARNLAFDASRRRETVFLDSGKIEDMAAARHEGEELGAESQTDARRARQALLREGLEKLSFSERELLARRFAEGMPYWEIGLLKGVSAQGAKMRLFRGKRKLRSFIHSRMRHPQSFVVSQAG